MVGLLIVITKFTFTRSMMAKRASSRMNAIKGGFGRVIHVMECVRLTVSSHITVP